jgi:hypothetical protein
VKDNKPFGLMFRLGSFHIKHRSFTRKIKTKGWSLWSDVLRV